MAISNFYTVYIRNSACLGLAFFLSCAQINAVEPTESGDTPPPRSAKAVRATLVASFNAIDYYPLTLLEPNKKALGEEHFKYADTLWASTKTKQEYSGKQLELIRLWLADDNNFKDNIEKRCKPGKAHGLHFLMPPNSGSSDIKGVVDFTCASLRFYDTDGNWITSTYFDPSINQLKSVFELANRK